jgi:hypothetical protein
MTLNELIEELQDAADRGHGDIEVRIAYQPNYPLAARIACITTPDDLTDDEEEEEEDTDGSQVLWLATREVPSSENPYAPRAAWQ